MEGEFEAGETELILRAARVANKAMHDARRPMEFIVKVAKAAETKRCADQARVTLALDQFKRLDDRDWTTQLLAAGNKQKGRTERQMSILAEPFSGPRFGGVFSFGDRVDRRRRVLNRRVDT